MISQLSIIKAAAKRVDETSKAYFEADPDTRPVDVIVEFGEALDALRHAASYPPPVTHLVGSWAIAPADPWHVENWQASAYSTVGIARDGEVKALAVSTGETDEGDYIVAALNFYAQHGGQP